MHTIEENFMILGWWNKSSEGKRLVIIILLLIITRILGSRFPYLNVVFAILAGATVIYFIVRGLQHKRIKETQSTTSNSPVMSTSLTLRQARIILLLIVGPLLFFGFIHAITKGISPATTTSPMYKQYTLYSFVGLYIIVTFYLLSRMKRYVLCVIFAALLLANASLYFVIQLGGVWASAKLIPIVFSVLFIVLFGFTFATLMYGLFKVAWPTLKQAQKIAKISGK